MKNINEESIFQEEIKKSNKRKSRSGNIFKKYIVVLLTFISIACAILSLREIKANIRYIIPGGIYLNGDLSNNISDYINLVKDYSIYYKSLEYASDNNNITQNDIDICKAELVDKVNKEYENYRNDKYTLFGGRIKLPVMDEIEDDYFFVPMHHDVTVADARKIVKIIKEHKNK